MSKLLLPYAGGTIIEAAADAARTAAADAHLAVVSGESPRRLLEILRAKGFEIVVNPDPESEMAASARVAFRQAARIVEESGQLGPHGLLLFLGDLPEVPSGTAPALVEAFNVLAEQGCGGRIVVPVCGGRRGHPALFDLSLVAEIESLPQGVGLNHLTQTRPGRVHEVVIDSAGIFQDLDTPEDYRRLTAREPPAASQ